MVQLMDMIFSFLEQLFPESSGHPADHGFGLSPAEVEQTQSIAMKKLQVINELSVIFTHHYRTKQRSAVLL